MTKTTERPLVTFAVIAYNQERFIREAIEGAFAQTYEPLEIILSDDGSPDRTFEIMQEMAAGYSGPHRVVLNRNNPNLGLVPHIDRVMELVKGDFIVVNAGDDVSVPERTEKLVSTWLQSDREIKLIHSAAMKIDEFSKTHAISRPPEGIISDPESATIICKKCHVIGATAAWDIEVYQKFGPLAEGLSTEDRVLPFRATLLGRLAYIDQPLVYHRCGGISSLQGPLTAEGYLYGIGHRLRKWTLEIDNYILKRFGDIVYKDKELIERTCRERLPSLQLHVDLAEASHFERFLMLGTAIKVAIHDQSTMPLKHWIRYLCDWVYIPYSNWKLGLGHAVHTSKNTSDTTAGPLERSRSN